MYAKIINWIKNQFAPKAKEATKKYWGYIAAFLIGLLAAFGLNSARNSRARKHIEQLRRELEQYADLNRRLEEYTDELERKANELGEFSSAATWENSQLRDQVRRAREDIGRLELELAESLELAGRAEDVTERLSDESARIGEGINQLREFLNKYGATTSDV